MVRGHPSTCSSKEKQGWELEKRGRDALRRGGRGAPRVAGPDDPGQGERQC